MGIVFSKSIVNLHLDPKKKAPVVSQGSYAEPANILETQNEWARIETADRYQGWCLTEHLSSNFPYLFTQERIRTGNICTHIYPTASFSQFPPLLSVPQGTWLKKLSTYENWVKVELLDGQKGWIEKRTCQPASPTSFLNIPYTWGGRSSFGLDCSGLIQLLAKEQGISLPRDAYQQITSEWIEEVEERKAGDLIFCRTQGKVDHVMLYLGKEQLLHASTKDFGHQVGISSVKTTAYPLSHICRLKKPTFKFKEEKLPTFRLGNLKDCPVTLNTLCYLKLTYWGYDDCVHWGELVVHRSVVQDLKEIFSTLFNWKFPLGNMQLPDQFAFCDEASATANNTYAFFNRNITGCSSPSKHSWGVALDINPLVNPYVRDQTIIPSKGKFALENHWRGEINPTLANLFKERGWAWGGDWKETRGYSDPHHFEKVLP